MGSSGAPLRSPAPSLVFVVFVLPLLSSAGGDDHPVDQASLIRFEQFCVAAFNHFGGKFTIHVEIPEGLEPPSDQKWSSLVSFSSGSPFVELKYSPLADAGKWGEGGIHLFPKVDPSTLYSLATTDGDFRRLLNTGTWLFSPESSPGLAMGNSTPLRLDSSVYVYENSVSWARGSLDSSNSSSGNNSSNGPVRIHEVYGVKGRARRNDDVGEWRPGPTSTSSFSDPGVFLLFDADGPSSSRRDLGGVTLLATLMPYSPMCNVRLAPGSNDTVVGIDGALCDSFNALSARLNFVPSFFFPPDRAWGAADAEGRWNGMVRQLMEGEADLTGVVLSITEERSEVVSYSVPMYGDKLTLLQLPRAGVSVDFLAYLAVFSTESWTAVAVSTLVLAAALAAASAAAAGAGMSAKRDSISELARRPKMRAKVAPDFASRPATFESELWRSLATVSLALLQRDVPAEDAAANSGDTDSGCCRLCGRSPPQSPPATSRSFAVRLVYVSACLASFVLFAFYTGVLTSLMTVSTVTNPIKSFSDALRLNYQILTWKNTADEDKLRFAPPGTTLNKIYEETVKGNDYALFATNAESVVKARADHKNLILGSRFLYQAIEPALQALDLEDPIVDDLAFTFPRDSEFRDIFDYYLNKLKESGSLSWSQHRWMPSDKDSGGSSSSSSNSEAVAFTLGYNNVLFPFLILVIGLAAGPSLALLERCAQLLFAGRTLASRDLDSSRLVTLGVDSRSRRWAEDRGGGGGIKRKKRASRQASSSSWHLNY